MSLIVQLRATGLRLVRVDCRCVALSIGFVGVRLAIVRAEKTRSDETLDVNVTIYNMTNLVLGSSVSASCVRCIILYYFPAAAVIVVRLSDTFITPVHSPLYTHNTDCAAVRVFIVHAVVTSCTHTYNIQRVYIDRHAHYTYNIM